MFGLTSLLSPKTGLLKLKEIAEGQLKRKINLFQIVYTANPESIYFLVDSMRVDYDGGALIDMIKSTCKQYLTKGNTLDIAAITYDTANDKAYCKIGCTDSNGTKSHSNHEL